MGLSHQAKQSSFYDVFSLSDLILRGCNKTDDTWKSIDKPDGIIQVVQDGWEGAPLLISFRVKVVKFGFS